MKRFRVRYIRILAVCLATLACSICAAYAYDGGSSAYLTTRNTDEKIPVRAKVFEGSEYFFLPSGADGSNTMYEESSDEGAWVVMSDSGICSLHFFSSDPVNFGIDYIHGSRDHSTKAPGRAVMLDEQLNVIYSGDVEAIKGRGNSSWLSGNKKPYQIKLAKKADLLDPEDGSQKAKKWILLANAFDASLLRNQVAFSVSEKTGLRYTPEGKPVDLYYDGDYRGSYYLCEKVEVGDGRVEIKDLDKDPEGLTGGYLLETDNRYYLKEPNWFNTSSAGYVVIRSPEEPTDEQKEYISSFVGKVMDIVAAGGRDENGEFVLFDYIDRESSVRYFLVMEWSANIDAFLSSAFMYKPDDEEKLYFGPVWDFDFSMGNPSYGDAERWKLLGLGGELMKIPEFRQAVKDEYVNEFSDVLEGLLREDADGTDPGSLDSMIAHMESSAMMNYYAQSLKHRPYTKQIYDSAASDLRKWLTRRYRWMENAINDDGFVGGGWMEAYRGDEAREPQKQSSRPHARPGKPKIKTSRGKRSVRVSWAKVKSASGYQVKYCVKGKKKAKIKTTRGKSIRIKKLKQNTKYVIRVRAYRKVNGKKLYGSWSNPKTVRTR